MLRKPKTPQQGRLKNSDGNFVFSNERADTLGIHLQNIQWAVRPATLISRTSLIHDVLDVDCDIIKNEEVKSAVDKLAKNKSAGNDNTLAEHFKALCSTPAGLELATRLCQLCWESESLPQR